MVSSATEGLIAIANTSNEEIMQGHVAGVSAEVHARMSGISTNVNVRISGVSQYYVKTRPRRFRQAGVPTPNLRELVIWSRVSGNSVYLVYNDPLIGVVKKQLE